MDLKTLNDILTANCLRYKEIKSCQECKFWDDCNGKKVNALIIEAVGEWLRQKRQAFLYSARPPREVIDELLEELGGK